MARIGVWEGPARPECSSSFSRYTETVTELPHQNPSRIKTRETRLHYQNKMRNKYAKSKAINEVVATIKRGKFIYYSDIAKKYKCNYNALFKRIYKLTKIKKDADSF
jgi:hypothetical protein